MSNQPEHVADGNEDRLYAIRLGFLQIDCIRCHGTRVRGLQCPICGAQPAAHEVDPERQRRQRAARRLLDYMHDESTLEGGGHAEDLDAAFVHLAEMVPLFLSSLRSFVSDRGDDGEQIRVALTHLHMAQASLRQAPRRPKVWRHRMALRIVKQVTHATSSWLTAIAADDPLTAQRASDEAQEYLDNATETIGALNDSREAWDRIGEAERPEDILGLLHTEAVRAGGHEDLLGLEEAGAADFLDHVGVSCPPGFGTGFRVAELVSQFALDVDRYRSVVRTAVGVLHRDQARLELLLNSPSMASDLLEGEVHGAMAWITAQAVWATSRTNEHDLREMVRLGGELLEGAGKRYIAALTTITRPQSYEDRRRKNAGQLLREARADGLASLVEGFDTSLRNAAAHVDYLIQDDVVVLTERGEPSSAPRRLQSAELIDEVLKATESCLALGIAMNAVAAINDRSLFDVNTFLIRLGASDLDLVRLALRLGGIVDVEVAIEVQTLVARGRTVGRPGIFRALAIATEYLPASVERLDLTILTPDGTANLSGPANPWREWKDSVDSLQKELAIVECMTSWKRDGEALLSEAQRRKILAAYAAKFWPEQPYPACVRPLRRIRDIAYRLEDQELATSIGSLIAMARHVAFDEPASLEEQAAVQRIVDWGSMTVNSPQAP